ncbi:HemX protein [Pasteurellaceae bacterium Orientalotternb1]|nr:HemX protein [Pasteurellaceae bacterium Orientalotternb1]
MTKQNKKQISQVDDVPEQVIEKVEGITPEPDDVQQAVRSSENFAREAETMTDSQNEPKRKEEQVEDKMEQIEIQPTSLETEKKQKSGGSGLALLALLIAIGVGGAGYFFGQQKFASVEEQLAKAQQQIQQLSQQAMKPPVQTAVEIPNFDAEKAQIAKLVGEHQQTLELIRYLEREQANGAKQINGLQTQLQKLGSAPQAEPTAFLLSDADFLLTNALRKVVIDNDIETAKSLLVEADSVLSQVNEPNIAAIREAIKADLNTLATLNKVDQNNIMQRLAQLANVVDDMPMLDNEQQLADQASGDVSDSLADWQKNIEKSADSFLSHFIRVSDKKQAQDKVFIAPNQEIYLRENIRLRLQIAILTVPRQQNELYKQSLEAVSSWVRSYFDVQNENVKMFLKEVDDLIEQSIYIDAPNNLQSPTLLKQKLNRAEPTVKKIELEVDKAVEQLKIEQPVEQAVQPQAEPQQ